MSAKILVVDDDPQIREVLRITLERDGHDLLSASDGAAALALAQTARPDLLILDIGLPEMDGLEVCRRIRKTSEVPILFLTARDDEVDRVVGFELGADDYVTKPFSPRELSARVRAILKRSTGGAEAAKSYRRGLIELAPALHSCLVAGTEVHLTASEMALLALLMARPEQVFSRPQLTDALYGANPGVSDRTLDSHLRNMRAKLAAAGCGDAVVTVHGVGVRMGSCGQA